LSFLSFLDDDGSLMVGRRCDVDGEAVDNYQSCLVTFV
jgi:hypothetical protein